MEKHIPRVSVIMPAYRVTEYIGPALDSVLAQTFRDFEILVINDGCPDTENLERVLSPYQAHIVYLKQQHGGLASARNTGIRASRGRLLALLDGDDLWEPDYLKIQVESLEADPSIDVLYPNAVYFGETPAAGRTFMELCPSRGEVTLRSLVEGQCAVFGGVTARTDTVMRVGMFDASLGSAEDFELWLRILNQGGKIAYHEKPLVRYRSRVASLSNDPIKIAQQRQAALEKARRTMNLTPAESECLDRAIAHQMASADFYLGKRALFAGDSEEARRRLSQANHYFHSRKTAFALWMLRFAPGLLRRMVHLRYKTEFAFMH